MSAALKHSGKVERPLSQRTRRHDWLWLPSQTLGGMNEEGQTVNATLHPIAYLATRNLQSVHPSGEIVGLSDGVLLDQVKERWPA